jgi:hypothetical protein
MWIEPWKYYARTNNSGLRHFTSFKTFINDTPFYLVQISGSLGRLACIRDFYDGFGSFFSKQQLLRPYIAATRASELHTLLLHTTIPLLSGQYFGRRSSQLILEALELKRESER